MTIQQLLREPMYLYLPEVIHFLATHRATTDARSDSLRVGINYTIILMSACYVEGALEAGLKALLWRRRNLYSKVEMFDFDTRKTISQLFNRVLGDLEARVSRAAGLANYDDMFEVIMGERISKYDLMKPLWEGVTVLFHFRNVIAHGREITASLTQGWWTNGSWEEDFSGGYRKTEDYLLKNKLIDKRFVEDTSQALYFTDGVADHFQSIAEEFIKGLSESLADEDKKAFDSTVWPS
jgi:hypothetical protein